MAETLPIDTLLDDNEETLTLLLSRKSLTETDILGYDELGASLALHEDLGRRLQRLSDRWLLEMQSADSSSSPTSREVQAHWTSLLDAARSELGFVVVPAATAVGASTANARDSTESESSSAPLVAEDVQALSTPEGNAHLEAVSALLGCSKEDAAKLTLGALRRRSSSTMMSSTPDSAAVKSSASDLVGTRALLETVIEHHQSQQIAQLQIVAECLRLELSERVVNSDDADDEGENDVWIAEKVTPVLEVLDASYHVASEPQSDAARAPAQHKKRGLFRWLLSLSTMQHVAWTRDQFEPSRKLKGSLPGSLQYDPAQSHSRDDDASFHEWRHSIVNRYLAFQGRQKVEALEAMVVLLYERLEGGVSRSDYALLLLAMDKCYGFYGQTRNMPPAVALFAMRLQCLASLICVEAMGLWRLVPSTKESSLRDTSFWVVGHPLLAGVVDKESTRFMAEMDALTRFHEGLVSRFASRRHLLTEEGVVGTEGVAAFSLSLVLSSAYSALLASESHGSNTESYWQSFQQTGATLFELANNSCDAFNSLYSVFDHMVEEPRGHRTIKAIPSLNAPPFELREFCEDLPVICAEPSATERELSGSSLIYANVGRELVVGIIVTFEDMFLSKHHSSAVNNLSMMSMLAAKIFRNSPSLCNPFWEEWSLHSRRQTASSAERNEDPLPLCRFLDSTYHLSLSGLSTRSSQQLKSSDEVLQLCAPVLNLCACLVYDSQSTEVVVQDVLPPTFIRTVMEAIATRHWNVPLDLTHQILSSILNLAEIGQAPATLQALRHSFDVSAVPAFTHATGPRLLTSVVAAFADDCRVTSVVCKLLALLASNAPATWVLDVTSSLHNLWSAPVCEPWTTASGERFASFRVALLHAFVKRMPDVLTCGSCSNESKITFIAFLDQGVNGCVLSLPGSLAMVAPKGADASSSGLPHSLICEILGCAADALEAAHQSMSVSSPPVGSAAEAMRSSLVSSLSTTAGLGDAVWYYACYPVTLVLAGGVANYLNDLQVTTQQHQVDLGPAMRLVNGPSSQREILQSAVTFLTDNSAASELEFDFDGICSKGWLSHEDAAISFEISLAALRLLRAWALSVEDIVRRENSDVSLFALGCHRFLLHTAVVPPVCRRLPNFSVVWNASNVSQLTLILQLLAVAPGRVPTAVSTGAFDVLFLALRQAHDLSDCDLGDKSIIRRCSESRLLSKLVEGAASTALISSEADGMNTLDCTELSLALRCFRIVSLCLNALPNYATYLLGKEAVSNMCEVVSGTVAELMQDDAEFSDMVLLNRMRNACGCLGVIVPLWSFALKDPQHLESESWVVKVIDENSHVLSDLGRLLFTNSKFWRHEMPPEASMTGQRLLYCFLSTSLELLTVETKHYVESVPDIHPDHPLLFALQTGMDQRLSTFCGIVPKFLSLPSIDLYRSAYLGVDDTMHWALSSPSPRDVFEECHGYDSFSAVELPSGYRAQSLARSLLESDLHRWRSFTAFSLAIYRLLSKWRLAMPNHPLLLSMSSDSFSLQTSTMILRALHENLIRLENCQDAVNSSFLMEVAASVTQSSSLLLLQSSYIEALKTDDINAAELFLRLLSDCMNKLVLLFGGMPQLACLPMQEMLMSAVSLLSVERNLRPAQGPTLSMESKISLALACCAFLQLVTNTTQNHTQVSRSCFCACTVVLTELVGSSQPHSKKEYTSALLGTFTEQRILPLISRHAVTMSTGVAGTTDVFPITSSVRFLKAVSLVGDTEFLDCVMDCAHVVLGRASAATAASPLTADAQHRGYGQQNYAFYELWTETLEFVSTLLLACAPASAPTRHRVASLSFTFLNGQREIIYSCLQIFFPTSESSSKVGGFTLRLLREASLILSIASELCTPFHVGSFQRECPDFFAAIVPCCCALLGRIGSVLGAATASRDLFKLLSEYENAAELSENNFSSLSPAHRLLASTGFPNAKHEALRLSTFVSRSVEAVSSEEKALQSAFSDPWTRPQHPPTLDPRSLSSLENSCRSAVTSNFEFQAEGAAAEVLFFAARLLRFTHPAASSFVTFSEKEASALDSMPLVKDGSVISFRSSGLDDSGSVTIRFGEVLHCDTVRRNWRVRLLGVGCTSAQSDGTESIVSTAQLAGIEDVSKRRCVLALGQAPESSADVESAMGSPSVAHLILSLRWCQQRFVELKANSRGGDPPPDMAVIHRLAEVSTVLLCTEVSLHRLAGVQPASSARSRTSSHVLPMQLLELFADPDELAALVPQPAAGHSADSQGRTISTSLKSVLDTAMWLRVREQLRPELDRAREEREARARDVAPGGAKSPRFGAMRRSDHRSPFRGIGI